MLALQRLQPEESDRALIRRFARQRDDEAFSILMGRYVDMVCTTCRRILGDETQSADAVQETFFQLAKDADRIEGSLGGWLHRVATRRAVDVIRQNVSRRRREESYASDGVCRSSTWSEVEPAVDEALEELPEALREVLLLHFLQGRTTTQIAAAQGTSQSTVSRRMNEALESLRQILRERGVQAGLVPLQAVLLHGNYAASQALRCGLGKIALAKATLSSTASAASASAPAGAGAVKIALAGAALVLATGTTWVAHKELSQGPAPIAAQTSVALSAPLSADSAAPQTGLESEPAQGSSAPVPRQPRMARETVDTSSLALPGGFGFPGQQTLVQGAPQVVLPFIARTNIPRAHTGKTGMTNAKESPLSELATNAPLPRAAGVTPFWLYSGSGGAEVYAGAGVEKLPAGADEMALGTRGFNGAATEGRGTARSSFSFSSDAGAFNGGITAGPFPARGSGPFFLPNRTPGQGQKK
jgi:RNA polymerase sigma factor (sigma-70 family)